MKIVVRVYRSDEWLLEQRLLRGDNIAEFSEHEVDPVESSLDAKHIFLEFGDGKYPDSIDALTHRNDFTLSRRATDGRCEIIIDKDCSEITTEDIDIAIVQTRRDIRHLRDVARTKESAETNKFLSQAVATKSEALEEVRKRLKYADESIKDLKTKLDEQNPLIIALRLKIKAAKKDREEYEEHKLALEKRIGEMNDSRTRLIQDITDLQQELLDCKTRWQVEMIHEKGEKSELERSNDALRTANQSHRRKITRLEKSKKTS